MNDLSTLQILGYIISTAAFTAGIFVCIVAFLEWLYPEKDTANDFADGDIPHIPCWSDSLFHNGTDNR